VNLSINNSKPGKRMKINDNAGCGCSFTRTYLKIYFPPPRREGVRGRGKF